MGKVIREKLTKEDGDAWYTYRSKYCNASEVGVILGLSKYQVAADLFLKKTGFKDDNRDGNEITTAGQMFEDVIADAWEYYDFSDPKAYILNYKHKHKIRFCERKNGSLRNTDFPWISVSLDRVIKKGEFNLLDGSKLLKQHPLEIKFIEKYVMDQFKSGIPTIYLTQLMTQMAVSEVDYGELFMMSTDRRFHLYPMEYRVSLGDAIKEHTKIFYDLVLRGNELKKEYDRALFEGKTKQANEIMIEVDRITPLPNEGQEELYKEFLNEWYNKTELDSHIMGSEKDLELAKEIVYLKELSKEVNSLCECKTNKIKSIMKSNEIMNFENTDFALTWKSNKNGQRSFSAYKPEKMDSKKDLIEFCGSKKITIDYEYNK